MLLFVALACSVPEPDPGSTRPRQGAGGDLELADAQVRIEADLLAPPVVVDLDGDGVDDLVLSTLDGLGDLRGPITEDAAPTLRLSGSFSGLTTGLVGGQEAILVHGTDADGQLVSGALATDLTTWLWTASGDAQGVGTVVGSQIAVPTGEGVVVLTPAGLDQPLSSRDALITVEAPALVSAGDLDSDGVPDVIVREESGRVAVVPGPVSGTHASGLYAWYQPASKSSTAPGVAVGDVTTDGIADLLVADGTDLVVLSEKPLNVLATVAGNGQAPVSVGLDDLTGGGGGLIVGLAGSCEVSGYALASESFEAEAPWLEVGLSSDCGTPAITTGAVLEAGATDLVLTDLGAGTIGVFSF